MRSIYVSISVAFGAVGILWAHSAAAQSYTPERMLRGVKLEDLRAIVASFGDEVLNEGMAGETSLSARSADGTVYLLLGTACLDEALGCQGVNMQVRYDAESVDYAEINAVNMSEQAVNTWFDPGTDTLGFSRYVVLDHGVTMENLRENVRVLVAIVPSAAKNLR